MSTTLSELQALLKDKYDVDETTVGPDTAMQEGGLDSLAVAEFMFAVEDHFGITLPDDDPNINTLAQLADLVDRVKAAKAAAPASPEPSPTSAAPATEPAAIASVTDHP